MITRNYLYILIFALLLLNSVTLVYLFNSKPLVKEPKTSNYKYVNPFVSEISKEDLVVNLRPLREDLTSYLSDVKDYEYSLYIESLNSGANISIIPELRVNPASLSKVPVAMIAMKKIEAGEWSLDKTFDIHKEDLSTTWGDLYKRGPNYKISLKDLIVMSLENSDNTAHNVLYHNLSASDVADFGESLGLYELFDAEGNITAKEYSRIFRALYLSSYLDIESSEFILDALTRTKYDYYLEAGLPNEVDFSHKFGEKSQTGLYADSGIVYIKNRPLLITLLLRKKDPELSLDSNSALEIFKNVSEKTFNYFSK